jgi:hypothetical protein
MHRDQVTLNDFQRRVEQRLNAALKELGLPVDKRRAGWEEAGPNSRHREAVVHIRAQELDVRIREDSVSFAISDKGDYYEMLDYSDAEALADAFLTALTERWHKPRPT